MHCSEWEQRISEYIDGELPEADAALVERHLLECEHCARFFREVKSAGDRVAAAFDMPRVCAVGFADRVMRSIQQPRRRRRLPYILAALAASIMVAFLVTRTTHIGTVTRIMNTAGRDLAGGVEIATGASVQAAAVGARLAAGDTLRTSADRVVFVRLETGDEVIVNRDSVVTLAGRRPGFRCVVDVARGEAFTHAASGQGSFAVHTPAGTAEVIGTKFSVAFDPDAARASLTVVEGLVRFSNSGGAATVAAGEQSVASAGSAPSQPRKVDAHLLTAWTDPPSAARIQQAAEELVKGLVARVRPEKEVFAVGEPIYVTVELSNTRPPGSPPVNLSRALFVGMEDTAARREHYKLSQVMLTRVRGAELMRHAVELPEPDRTALKPGASWRVRLDLTAPAEHPALRTIAGPGTYSIAAVFAVAGELPGAPDDSMVWADVASDSVVVHVISTTPPREGDAVAGLQLGLTSARPVCTLGEPLRLKFSLEGVSSDYRAINTAGNFRIKIQPATYGILSDRALDRDLPRKLDTTVAEAGLPGGKVTLRQLLRLLKERCGINTLADAALMTGATVELRPDATVSECLERLCNESGARYEVGRAALWVVKSAEGRRADVSAALAQLESTDGWVSLEGVEAAEGELKLTTGTANFPRPGLYRCTVEYSNTKTKTDWAAAWLGQVRSEPMAVAVTEPPPPAARPDRGLELILRREPDGGPATRLLLDFHNTSDEPIAINPADGLALTDEYVLVDLLNPDCYGHIDRDGAYRPAGAAAAEKQAWLAVLDSTMTIPGSDEAEGIAISELLASPNLAPHLGTIEGADAFDGRRIVANCREISAGEVLEFIARMCSVRFLYSGDPALRGGRTCIVPFDDRPPAPPAELDIAIPDQPGVVTIPPGGKRPLTLTVSPARPLRPGRHRLQVRYLRTGGGRGTERLWTGDARSNPILIDVAE